MDFGALCTMANWASRSCCHCVCCAPLGKKRRRKMLFTSIQRIFTYYRHKWAHRMNKWHVWNFINGDVIATNQLTERERDREVGRESLKKVGTQQGIYAGNTFQLLLCERKKENETKQTLRFERIFTHNALCMRLARPHCVSVALAVLMRMCLLFRFYSSLLFPISSAKEKSVFILVVVRRKRRRRK